MFTCWFLPNNFVSGLSSNQLENFLAKTRRSERKTYCKARQLIIVHHLVYRLDGELSYIMIIIKLDNWTNEIYPSNHPCDTALCIEY